MIISGVGRERWVVVGVRDAAYTMAVCRQNAYDGCTQTQVLDTQHIGVGGGGGVSVQ